MTFMPPHFMFVPCVALRRADALGFLELLMGCRPDLVASSSASLAPVLQHFGDLLSKGSRGRSIKVGCWLRPCVCAHRR